MVVVSNLLQNVFHMNLKLVVYRQTAQILTLVERYYTPMGIGVDNGALQREQFVLPTEDMDIFDQFMTHT